MQVFLVLSTPADAGMFSASVQPLHGTLLQALERGKKLKAEADAKIQDLDGQAKAEQVLRRPCTDSIVVDLHVMHALALGSTSP
jgi:hypothetical protein